MLEVADAEIDDLFVGTGRLKKAQTGAEVDRQRQ
jgi:hypothetical protein